MSKHKSMRWVDKLPQDALFALAKLIIPDLKPLPAARKLSNGGIIHICDTTTKTTTNNIPADCFPYWIDGNIADSVELNRIKQAYNAKSARYVSGCPGRYIQIESTGVSVPIREYVETTMRQIRELSMSDTIPVTGYVSYSYSQNCLHGVFHNNHLGYPAEYCSQCDDARIMREHFNARGEYIGDGRSHDWG